MDLFELLGKITIDGSKANDELDKTSRKGEEAQSKLSRAFSGIGKGAITLGKTVATGLAVGGAAMGALTLKALTLSGDLEQNMGGCEAVFGEYAAKMQDTAKNAFSNMGLSTSDYLATANKMGALFQGAGFTIEESMNLSSDAMQRAADVASIMGIDTTDAMEAIAGAAKGNFEMMDNLGVAMNDATLQAYALEKGISKSTQEMTNQEKIGLAMEMFLDKTAYATGNYAKENETLAGSLGTAKAALTNFLDGSGDVDALVDSFSNLADVVIKSLETIAPRLISGVTDIIGKVAQKLPGLINELLPILIQGATNLINGLVQAMPAIIDALMSALPMLIEGVEQIINGLIEALPTLMEAFVSALPELIPMIVDALVSMIVTLCSMIPEIIQPIIDYLPEIIISIVDALMDNLPLLIEGAIQLVVGLVAALPEIIMGLIEAIPQIIVSILEGLWNALPQLLAGIGEMLAAIGSAIMGLLAGIGEAIIGFFAGVWEGIKAVFGAVAEWFGNLFRAAWEAIQNAWNAVVEWFAGIWNGICDVFSGIAKWFGDIFSGAWEAIKNAWGAVVDWFTGVWEGIKGVFSGAIDWISDAWNGFCEFLGIKTNQSKVTVEQATAMMANGFAGTGTAASTAANAIYDKFKTMAGNTTGVMQNMASTVIGILDRMKNSASNAHSFISSFSFTNFSIPKMATGGIVNRPTIAQIGEDGREAVVPLENNTGWIRKIAGQIHEYSLDMRSEFAGVAPAQSYDPQQAAELQSLNNKMDVVVTVLGEYFPQMLEKMHQVMVLDTGVLVAETAPDMDVELGRLAVRKERGQE